MAKSEVWEELAELEEDHPGCTLAGPAMTPDEREAWDYLKFNDDGRGNPEHCALAERVLRAFIKRVKDGHIDASPTIH